MEHLDFTDPDQMIYYLSIYPCMPVACSWMRTPCRHRKVLTSRLVLAPLFVY